MTREEAIKIIDCYDIGFYDLSGAKIPADKLADAFDMAIEALSAEAVKGEWIDIDSYYRMATCSHCLKVTMFEKWGEYTRPYNFCPNCGARMLGEDGDSE